MNKSRYIIVVALLLLVGSGCESIPEIGSVEQKSRQTKTPQQITQNSGQVVLPVEPYLATYKRFGEYFEDRFRGYHVADDIEPVRVGDEVPVRAIADGTVTRVGFVSGYGGLITATHDISGRIVKAIYGHIDLGSSSLSVGDAVTKGQFIGNLGDDASRETDGERKHLHFGLYEGSDTRINGYETRERNVGRWINPVDFFAAYGVFLNQTNKRYSDMIDPDGKKIFNIDFEIPATWDVEYIPSLQALNLYEVAGSGTARDRSQILIRYFDADDFLTLPTVTIFETQDISAGRAGYTARRYDIAKKPGVRDFADQPAWRNQRHTVTDFRDKPGRTRYYVVAGNPALDTQRYQDVLDSMVILN